MTDNKKDVEVPIEESIEQLEEKVAPAADGEDSDQSQ